MPKRKSPEGAEGKEAPKVTKHEPIRRSERLSSKPAPPKPDVKPMSSPVKADVKPKKVLSKNPVDDKAVKGKKGVAKGKKEDGPAQNGETKICVSRSGVRVSSSRSSAPSLMSVRGQSETVQVKGN